MKSFSILLLITAAATFSAYQACSQGIQVNPLTGTAGVNLPVWVIKSADLSIPVGLSYSSGMKVNDSEGSAGIGWSLYAGGVVMRELRGLPDDFIGSVSNPADLRKGWLQSSFSSSFIPGSNETNDWNTLNGYSYTTDTEPDVFSFYAPGLSGQFVFDNSKVIRTIPYNDLKIHISKGPDSLINQIEITNDTGVKYTFQSGDKVRKHTIPLKTLVYQQTEFNYYSTPATYYRSWYLTQISSKAGGLISFAYGNEQEFDDSSYTRTVSESANRVDSIYANVYHTTRKNIETITGGNETATFAWAGPLLSSISISNGSDPITQRYNLRYGYVKSSANYFLSSSTSRSFLVNFYKDMNCQAFPGYFFEYYGVNLSNYRSEMTFNSGLKQDLFGYYNGSGVSHVPDVYIAASDAGNDGERYRIAPASGYSLMGTSAGRGVDTSKVYFGSLKKVTLPSGGFSMAKYEAVNYYDSLTNSSILGGGPRVRYIRTSSNEGADVIVTYKYKLSNGQSSGQWTYRPMFVAAGNIDPGRVPDNMAPEESILHSRVEVSTNGRGKSVFEYQLAGMYAKRSISDFRATKSLTARYNSTGSLGKLKSGYYTYPYAPNTNYSFERGLIIRSSDYTRAGKLVARKLYTYQRTSLSTIPIAGVRFEKGNNIFQFSRYNLISNVNKLSSTETSRLYDQTSSDTTKFVETVTSYTLNSNQMVSEVAITNSDGSVLKKIYKYAKDYPTTGTDTQSSMINALVANNQHATMIESASKNGSAYTGAQLNLFGNFGGRILPIQQLALGNTAGFTSSSVVGSSFVYSSNYYPVAYIDAYDEVGNSLVTRDQRRMIQSVIMGHNKTFPELEIRNARHDEVVFNDFEPNLSTTSTHTGTLSYDMWSGRNSVSLVSGNTVSQSGVIKGSGNYYRFSCWAKASSALNINISINGGSAMAAAYTGAGAWQYVEKRIDMSAVTSPFSFSITPSASVLIDNVIFCPENAEVLAHTYDPLNGKTSDIDTRGKSSFQEFDEQGRIRYTRNRDKDVITINDYSYKSPGTMLPNSSFHSSVPFDQIKTGGYVMFAAPATEECFTTSPSYFWSVNDIPISGGAQLSYTFDVVKDYRVRLSATTASGTTSTEVTVHPLPQFSVSIPLGDINFACANPTQYTAVAVLTGCYDSANVSYTWTYIDGNSSTITTGPDSSSIVITPARGTDTYLKCVVTSKCFDQANQGPVTVLATASITFHWTGTLPCGG